MASFKDGLKYIDLPIPELYDLSSDPREEHNLAASQPARVEELRTLLGPFRDRRRTAGAAAGNRGDARTPEEPGISRRRPATTCPRATRRPTIRSD